MSLYHENPTASFSTSQELGTLIVVVMKAKNLHNKRSVSKQNPFCIVRVAKSSDKTRVVIRGGQSPTWDHEVRFKLNEDDDNRMLKVAVFDQNGSNADIIGDAAVELKPALNASTKQGYDAWHRINYNGKYVGEVYLEMTFYPKTKRRLSARSTASLNASMSHSHIGSPSLSPSASVTSLRRQLPAVPDGGILTTTSLASSGSSAGSSAGSFRSSVPTSPLRSSASATFSQRSSSPRRPLPSIPGASGTGAVHNESREPGSLYQHQFSSVPNLHSQLSPASSGRSALGPQRSPPMSAQTARALPSLPSLDLPALPSLPRIDSAPNLPEHSHGSGRGPLGPGSSSSRPRQNYNRNQNPNQNHDEYFWCNNSSPNLTLGDADSGPAYAPASAALGQKDISQQINDWYGASMFDRRH